MCEVTEAEPPTGNLNLHQIALYQILPVILQTVSKPKTLVKEGDFSRCVGCPSIPAGLRAPRDELELFEMPVGDGHRVQTKPLVENRRVRRPEVVVEVEVPFQLVLVSEGRKVSVETIVRRTANPRSGPAGAMVTANAIVLDPSSEFSRRSWPGNRPLRNIFACGRCPCRLRKGTLGHRRSHPNNPFIAHYRLSWLKELNHVAGRVFAENLFATVVLYNIVSEFHTIVLEL